jgi:hypothetical protein
MSMFDYDARRVTPRVVLVGNRASSAGYTIRDFLSRNGVPHDWVDIEDPRCGLLERLTAWIDRYRLNAEDHFRQLDVLLEMKGVDNP